VPSTPMPGVEYIEPKSSDDDIKEPPFKKQKVSPA
jgi:hypothetical protein